MVAWQKHSEGIMVIVKGQNDLLQNADEAVFDDASTYDNQLATLAS